MGKKEYIVIGLGQFGMSIAQTLMQNDCEVLVLDINEKRTRAIADSVTCAVTGNVMDAELLAGLGIRNFDGAVIAIGENMEASIMATIFSKEAGIPYVLAKARSETHAEVLKKVGADQTILPEREMGSRVARNMVFGKFMDTFELSVTYSMAELEVPESWIGKSLRELDVRGRYGINVIAAHEGDRINANLDPDEPLAEHQIILIVGNNDDLKKVK